MKAKQQGHIEIDYEPLNRNYWRGFLFGVLCTLAVLAIVEKIT